jgi:hypothetical protein
VLSGEHRVPGFPGRGFGPLAKGGAKTLGLTILDLASMGRQVRDRRGEVIAALRDNKAICRPEDVAMLNKLRVQYSREIVGQAALKLGWQKVVKTENKLLLRKGV